MSDEETAVVTAFLRSSGEVLLCRRSDAVGTYPGRWGGVSGYAEGDPDAQVRREIAEETGLADAVSSVRSGRPITVEDGDRTWRVHPYLFDCDSRDVTLSEEHDETRWTSPTAALTGDLRTVPRLWDAYERVAPTVRTIAADADHGAATLSLRALEVLRDRAAVLVAADGDPGDGWDELGALARRLRSVRPSMAVLRNRINRAMSAADPDGGPASVHAACLAGIERAVAVDDAVAAAVSALVDGTVLTLSRSRTVREGLERAVPDRLFVAESRPGLEGTALAESLAETVPVTLHTDAAAAALLDREPIDRVLVGADTILPDGSVVNKTGTRGLALAADREGVTVTVAAATDKVSPAASVNLESGPSEAVYDGPGPLDVANPTFDVTPGAAVDEIVTEDGPIAPEGVADLADALGALESW